MALFATFSSTLYERTTNTCSLPCLQTWLSNQLTPATYLASTLEEPNTCHLRPPTSKLDEPTECHFLPPLLAHLSNQPLATRCQPSKHSLGTNLSKLAPYLAYLVKQPLVTYCHHCQHTCQTNHLQCVASLASTVEVPISWETNNHLLLAHTLTWTLENLLALLSLACHLLVNFDEPSTFHFHPSLLEHCMSLLLHLLAINENILIRLTTTFLVAFTFGEQNL
jgi:hypothetical protein